MPQRSSPFWSRIRRLLFGLASVLALVPELHAQSTDWTATLRTTASSKVLGAEGEPIVNVQLTGAWNTSSSSVRFRLRNDGERSVRIREVVLFDEPHRMPTNTPIYAEGFQMLSQTAGTLGTPRDLGGYTDRDHYRLPEKAGFRTVYGMLLASPASGPRILFGFTSCRRFNGKFEFNGERLRAVIETEDLELPPGQVWELEELLIRSETDRDTLLGELASAIEAHHPRLQHEPVPVGWCSWYCFGPGVTARNITDNLDWIAKNFPALRYIQIDDGYQPWMGDWLDTGKAFGGDVQGVLKTIRERGFEPAIWVAPFVASEQSRLFREHPDWMVQDADGKPLRSDRVGFGGWRLGPWYVLDGTHPEVQKWMEDLFRTMRTQWGCTYFKLDATYWGTLPGGRRHDPKATRIEAYRRGMEAIRRGAGDAVILGCNHPMWPSLGLIHASRSSLDIERHWSSFTGIGRENLLRGWQNGRLWWNDPDCIVLTDQATQDIVDPAGRVTTTGKVPDNEFQFHTTLMFATGGMILAGDDLTRITPRRLAMLRKLVPPAGTCARFADDSFELGITALPGRTVFSVLNWTDQPAARRLPLEQRSQLSDYLTGEDLGVHEGAYSIAMFPARFGRLIEARPMSPGVAVPGKPRVQP
jgi:alpha-galactosidase